MRTHDALIGHKVFYTRNGPKYGIVVAVTSSTEGELYFHAHPELPDMPIYSAPAKEFTLVPPPAAPAKPPPAVEPAAPGVNP